jgi:phosphate transport system substrate-binding protein
MASGGANTLTGAGSTFVYPIMTRWIQTFQQSDPGVQINYQSIGSGGGIQQLKKGLVAFGASDVALDDQQLKEMSGTILQVPESAGPVCITYNLPELNEPLKIGPDALANIFLGKIKNWNDGAIASTNPGVKLPNTSIAIAHRSDGSGTTYIFTSYLSVVSPDWQKGPGTGISVRWPAGLGGKGSEGVTGIVKQTPGAIGYVELSYAEQNNLPVAQIENKAGKFIAPSAESASAAIDAFASQLSNDVRIPIVNSPASAPNAYPISGLTFLLLPRDGNNRQQRQNLKNFVQYIVTQGQDIATQFYYAKLPASLVQIDQKLLGEMTANSQPLK